MGRMDNTVVLPFMPGDDFWWVDSETREVCCEKNGIVGVAIYADRIDMIDRDGERWSLGEQWFFLTKEDAEEFRDTLLKEE